MKIRINDAKWLNTHTHTHTYTCVYVEQVYGLLNTLLCTHIYIDANCGSGGNSSQKFSLYIK